MSNPYQPPESEITPPSTPKKPHFSDRTQYQSILELLALTLLTLGFYVLFWFYKKTNIINQMMPENPIPTYLLNSAIALFVISFIVSLFDLVNPGQANIVLTSSLLGLLSNISILVLVFSIRNRLNQIAKIDAASPYWLNIVLTLLLGVLYIQFKINKMITNGYETDTIKQYI